MTNILTRGSLTLALLALSALAAGPVLAIEAAGVAARSFAQTSTHQLGLAAMVVILFGLIGIAVAHWKALAHAFGYRAGPASRRFTARG